MNNELMVERHGPVAWLTVNRPEVRNALSLEITQRIAETLRELSRDRTLRVFVLTGAGDRVFVSGADVREFSEQLATPESALRYDAAAEQLQSALREVPAAGYCHDPGPCGGERDDRCRILRFSHRGAHG